MGCTGSLWARTDAGNCSIRLVITKMVKNGLKNTFIDEICCIKMPKKGNLHALLFVHLHAAPLPESRGIDFSIASTYSGCCWARTQFFKTASINGWPAAAPKRIVPNLPIHPILLAEVVASNNCRPCHRLSGGTSVPKETTQTPQHSLRFAIIDCFGQHARDLFAMISVELNIAKAGRPDILLRQEPGVAP